ncbi:hypothetical protein OUZ56_009486 [Daphnia magna]|uniref:Uncharacterized protein n=1 Tax=Daphnia magna TaxID=35525 RepID=A0ABR0AG57_9CRUS|nr:hypothetical protein OUZ56_009486 [Daphnia magna]
MQAAKVWGIIRQIRQPLSQCILAGTAYAEGTQKSFNCIPEPVPSLVSPLGLGHQKMRLALTSNVYINIA